RCTPSGRCPRPGTAPISPHLGPTGRQGGRGPTRDREVRRSIMLAHRSPSEDAATADDGHEDAATADDGHEADAGHEAAGPAGAGSYLSRELSWLDFDARVLHPAA